jgi:hypothetical protein
MASPVIPISSGAPASAPASSAPASSSAPSQGASSTPSSTPATPQTPATSATPTGGAAAPGTGAAPAAPAAPPKGAEAPKATDFPNTTTGQYEFAKANNEWWRAHPDGAAAPTENAQAADATATETATATQANQGTEEQIADGQKPPQAEAAPATPRQLSELMEKTPEFGAFMDAHPEVKGPVFALARKLAEAEPILAIAPTVGDAQFLQEQASNQVALKTASLRTIYNPESVPEFLSIFDQQFQQVDAQGNPVVDAQGQPIFDADHAAVVGGLVNRELQKFSGKFKTEIEQLTAKLGGYYPNEAAKAADQKRLENLELGNLALQVLDQIRDGSIFETPAPALAADATEEQKAWFAQQQADLARQRQELDDQKKGANKEERTAAAQKFNADVRGDMGLAAGKIMQEALERIEESGAYIPEMYKQEKYRDQNGKEWNTPRISAELFIQFEKELMRPGSKTLLEITQHELLPRNEQTRKIRQEYYQRKAVEIIPGLVDKEVARIQALVKVDQQKQEEQLNRRRQAANPEPSTGGSSLPQGASDAQIMAAAEEAASKLPEWGSANPRDRQAMLITQVHKLSRKK